MRLQATAAEQEFRGELRSWLARDGADIGPRRRSDDWTGTARVRHGLAAHAFDAGYAGHQLAEGARRPRSDPPGTPDFPGGIGAGGRAVRRRQLRRAAARGPDADRRGEPRAAGGATCRRSCAATRSGARASPSRARGPTSPRCAPGRSATATTTSSPGRRSGPLTPRSPTTARCSSVPTRMPRNTRGSRGLIMPMDSPGITVRPLRTIIGSPSSPRCSSTRYASR